MVYLPTVGKNRLPSENPASNGRRHKAQGIRKKMPVLERSSHRYMSDEGREKAGYSKLAGFAAIVTKPYRPIGDLGGVMQNNRRPERGGSSSTTSTFDTDATKKHGRSTSPLHREAPASTNSLDSSSNHYPRVRFSNKAYGQSLKPRLQTRRNDVLGASFSCSLRISPCLARHYCSSRS